MPLSPPQTQLLDSILPAEPLLLMGAGPVPISHAVSRANGVVINHLGETMDAVVSNVKMMGRYAFQTVSDFLQTSFWIDVPSESVRTPSKIYRQY